MADPIRILFLADSHLGFDLPVKPRIERRRRGHDFLANYDAALLPALQGEVDLVIHGGDVFDRPGVDPGVGYRAFEPLRRIAERGTPVFLVPGNHERSSLPHLRFAAHPLIHVFDRPRTFVVEARGRRVALAGFPYERRDVRTRFPDLIGETGWTPGMADHHLLCVHHCVEGATVGPANFVFRSNPDVIRVGQVPPEFSALLSGHIHRHQVLTTDLGGRKLRVPVLYPGSIERTAFAEIGEPKGYLLLGLGPAGFRWEFRPLPARPMMRREIAVAGMDSVGLETAIRGVVAEAPADAVLAVGLTGELDSEHWRVLSAARLRALTPHSMNLELWAEGGRSGRGSGSGRLSGARGRSGPPSD